MRRNVPSEDVTRLNEEARLYPWKGFTQGEIEVMTGYPRGAVSAAFNAPEVPAQCGLARPEDVVAWIRRQDCKITVKALK